MIKNIILEELLNQNLKIKNKFLNNKSNNIKWYFNKFRIWNKKKSIKEKQNNYKL